MEIRRSEVYFDKFRSADPYAASAAAKVDHKRFFTQEDWQWATVFEVASSPFDFTEVCKVRDLIDDRPSQKEMIMCERCKTYPADPGEDYCAACAEFLAIQYLREDSIPAEAESPFPPLPAESSSDTPTDRARDAALREVSRKYDSFDDGITPPKDPELVRQLLESIAKEDGL